MIIIQLILFCALFTAMVKYSVRGGAIDGLYFYPQTVQERAFEIGLTTKETMLKKRGFLTLIWVVGSFIVAGIVVFIFVRWESVR